MNLGEFKQVLSWFDRSKLDERNGILYLQDTLQIKETLITKGRKGTLYHNANEILTASNIPITVNDPVGSGDAFLAGFLSKRLTNENLKTAMDHATVLDALIGTQTGACPDYNLKNLENFIATHPTKPHLNIKS